MVRSTHPRSELTQRGGLRAAGDRQPEPNAPKPSASLQRKAFARKTPQPLQESFCIRSRSPPPVSIAKTPSLHSDQPRPALRLAGFFTSASELGWRRRSGSDTCRRAGNRCPLVSIRRDIPVLPAAGSSQVVHTPPERKTVAGRRKAAVNTHRKRMSGTVMGDENVMQQSQISSTWARERGILGESVHHPPRSPQASLHRPRSSWAIFFLFFTHQRRPPRRRVGTTDALPRSMTEKPVPTRIGVSCVTDSNRSSNAASAACAADNGFRPLRAARGRPGVTRFQSGCARRGKGPAERPSRSPAET